MTVVANRKKAAEKHSALNLAQGSGGVKSLPLRFAADCMLGRLARWLRILGHDVVYFRRIDDGALVTLSAREKRTLLTRDTRLVLLRAARGAILIESPYLEDQLRQMALVSGPRLLAPGLCRRCLVCNEPIRPVEKDSVRNRIPAYVFRTQSRFLRCGRCDRIYWSASHVRDMVRRLRRTLGERPQALS